MNINPDKGMYHSPGCSCDLKDCRTKQFIQVINEAIQEKKNNVDIDYGIDVTGAKCFGNNDRRRWSLQLRDISTIQGILKQIFPEYKFTFKESMLTGTAGLVGNIAWKKEGAPQHSKGTQEGDASLPFNPCLSKLDPYVSKFNPCLSKCKQFSLEKIHQSLF